MYSFEAAAISRELTSSNNGGRNFLFPANSSYKNVLQNQLLKNKEIMGSDLYQQQQNSNSGLMRYRSAPSSFFAGLMEPSGGGAGNLDNFMANEGSSSSDSDSMFSSILNCSGSGMGPDPDSRDLKPEIAEESQKQRNMVYEAPPPAPAPAPEMVGSYGVEMQHFRNSSNNLLRQSSSPAGFFSGFDVMREAGNYKVSSNGVNGNSSLSTIGFHNNQINYASAQCSGSNYMPSIAEMESWNDSSYNSLKRTRDGDFKMLSNLDGIENQNGEPRNCTPGLTHHLSLPSSCVEIEKYLHFQQEETVPCKIRAKRGCATHPRSIAERNRRTRISDRMKKLQELFPKMDKQTSTADMLDWAVEHIKGLKKQVQILTDKKAKCTCSSKAHNQQQMTWPEDFAVQMRDDKKK